MATKELNSRIMQKASTEEEWEAVASTFIPLRGEVCVYFMTDRTTKIKIGDGTTTVANLPFVGGDTVDLSAFVTAEDPSAEVEGTLAETFGGHTVEDFVLKNEVANNLTSDSTDIPLSAAQGKALNESINSLQSDINTLQTSVIGINGGTMEGALIAQSNSNYTQRQVRNIILSTTEPSAGDGQDGDIWLIYEA